ncbi:MULTISPECIES: DUF3455 domain-containing protein [unclassified Variovorax]|uniref:DUF3455 domain-containing protein n=1 Tax=unclassified Variovorax TaxID=663243 RepID=UPI003ED038EE
MKSNPRIPRLAATLLGAAALGACSSMSEPGHPSARTAALPAAIQAPAGERAAFTWHATGSQIYECRAAEKGGWAWQFVAPEADLFGPGGEKVGTHGAGPHWTALDGSKTLGAVKARADAPRASDIPWLLLSAKSAGTAGRMASVTGVQRINTLGGSAPARGCETQADAGKRSKERYSADYVFLVAR